MQHTITNALVALEHRVDACAVLLIEKVRFVEQNHRFNAAEFRGHQVAVDQVSVCQWFNSNGSKAM